MRDDPSTHPRNADLLAAFPWDKVADYRELAERATALGLGFDAVNSNTFQDQPGQTLSYKFGSLRHAERRCASRRSRTIVECIEIGQKLGSKALTVWIADGSNFPGQSNLNRVFDWYLESMAEIYAGLPATGACSSSTSSTSRRSIRPSSPTGARA